MRTLLMLLLGLSARAQTNFDITTNWVTAHSSFRVVSNQLYNVDKSQLFSDFQGHILEILTNGVRIAKFTEKAIYARPKSDSLTSSGNFLGGSSRASGPIKVGTKEIPDGIAIIYNYPTGPNSTVGSIAFGRALLLR